MSAGEILTIFAIGWTLAAGWIVAERWVGLALDWTDRFFRTYRGVICWLLAGAAGAGAFGG